LKRDEMSDNVNNLSALSQQAIPVVNVQPKIEDTEQLAIRSLSSFKEELRQFLLDDAYARLNERGSTSANLSGRISLILSEQPDQVSYYRLRNYQLNGLNWMIEKYSRGISCILGDEEGLGSKIGIRFSVPCLLCSVTL
jgi:SNF2 family DNA or RNA helicase